VVVVVVVLKERLVPSEVERVDCRLAFASRSTVDRDAPHPHSGHLCLSCVLTLACSQMVSCESAGKPVHPIRRVGC